MGDDLALADMDQAIAAAQAIVAGIRDDQWPAATPCTDVDVRTLVNHLVSGNLHFAALVTQTAPFGTAPGVALVRTRSQLATRPQGAHTPFAAELPVPADAAAIDRLAGFLGRTV